MNKHYPYSTVCWFYVFFSLLLGCIHFLFDKHVACLLFMNMKQWINVICKVEQEAQLPWLRLMTFCMQMPEL